MAEAKAQVWTASIATLFPEMFPGPLGCSLAGRARADGLWRLETVDIRDCAPDKHRTVDDAPFGGGAAVGQRPHGVAPDDGHGLAVGADDRGVARSSASGRPPTAHRLRGRPACSGGAALRAREERPAPSPLGRRREAAAPLEVPAQSRRVRRV